MLDYDNYFIGKIENYFGFKIHTLITIKGFITDFTLTPANIDDRERLYRN